MCAVLLLQLIVIGATLPVSYARRASMEPVLQGRASLQWYRWPGLDPISRSESLNGAKLYGKLEPMYLYGEMV